MKMINLQNVAIDHFVVQNQGNVVSNMDGEKVMMNIPNGKYYNLGEIGGVIWDFVQNPVTVNDLIAYLISEYNVDKTECEEQVVSFLELLYKEGLIQIQEERSS